MCIGYYSQCSIGALIVSQQIVCYCMLFGVCHIVSVLSFTFEQKYIWYDMIYGIDSKNVDSICKRGPCNATARYVTGSRDYKWSATKLIQDLGWPTLEHRFNMMYKMFNHQVDIAFSSKCILSQSITTGHAFDSELNSSPLLWILGLIQLASAQSQSVKLRRLKARRRNGCLVASDPLIGLQETLASSIRNLATI